MVYARTIRKHWTISVPYLCHCHAAPIPPGASRTSVRLLSERVQRLGPPHWRRYPPARAYGDMAANDTLNRRETTRLGARLIANDLRGLGINVDCVPVADVPDPDGHEVIGDRAYGDTPELVAQLGRAACEGLIAGGVLPVIKHIPGHGRARADSHHELPVVDADGRILRGNVKLHEFIAGRPAESLLQLLGCDEPFENLTRHSESFTRRFCCDRRRQLSHDRK